MPRPMRSLAPTAPQVGVGYGFGCVVRQDGVVSCFGTLPGNPSSPPTNLGAFKMVAVGEVFTCGLLEDGEVVCFGFADSAVVQNTPTQLQPFESIKAGRSHVCAQAADRKLTCWGENGAGQLGISRDIAALTYDLQDDTTCVIRASDNRLACVGNHPFINAMNSLPEYYRDYCMGVHWGCGIITDGTIKCVGDAVAFPNVTAEFNARSVHCGEFHSCFFRPSGALSCYSTARDARLGLPTSEMYSALALGNVLSCGLTTDGRAIGTDACNQWQTLGASRRWRHVASDSHRWCAVDSTGSILCGGPSRRWTGSSYVDIDVFENPLPDILPTNAVESVTVGRTHACVLQSNGNVRCFGLNRGRSIVSSTPAGTRAVSITAGDWHTCILNSIGMTQCWGVNDVTHDRDYVHGLIRDASGSIVECWSCDSFDGRIHAWPGTGPFIGLSAGNAQTCALEVNSASTCFGVGFSTVSAQPYRVNPPAGFEAASVAMLNGPYCVAYTNGQVRCPNTNSFPSIAAATDVHSLFAGTSHICAIKRGGELLCGSTSTLDRATPPDPSIRVQSGAAREDTCVITVDSDLVCFGPLMKSFASPFLPPPAWFRGTDPSTSVQLLRGVGRDVACAIRSTATSSTVRCWGTVRQRIQFEFPRSSARRIGGAVGHKCGCVVEAGSGETTCWGFPSTCCFGDSTRCPHGKQSVEQLSIGWNHGCFLRDPATVSAALPRVQCWGVDSDGSVSGAPANAAQVVVGRYHSCAVAADRASITCFGRAFTNPVPVIAAPGVVVDACAGETFSCAAVNTSGVGSVHCWGNFSSALSSTVVLPRVAQRVSCGERHWCALLEDSGDIVCNGEDEELQVTSAPTDSGFVGVECGRRHCCATREDPWSVQCWGHASIRVPSLFAPSALHGPGTRELSTVNVDPTANVTGDAMQDCREHLQCANMTLALAQHRRRNLLFRVHANSVLDTPLVIPPETFLATIQAVGSGPHFIVECRNAAACTLNGASVFTIQGTTNVFRDVRVQFPFDGLGPAIPARFATVATIYSTFERLVVEGGAMSDALVRLESGSKAALSVTWEPDENSTSRLTRFPSAVISLDGSAELTLTDSSFALTANDAPESDAASARVVGTRLIACNAGSTSTSGLLQASRVTVRGDGWLRFRPAANASCTLDDRAADWTHQVLPTSWALVHVCGTRAFEAVDVSVPALSVANTQSLVAREGHCSAGGTAWPVVESPSLFRFEGVVAVSISSSAFNNVEGFRWMDWQAVPAVHFPGTLGSITVDSVMWRNWTTTIVAPLSVVEAHRSSSVPSGFAPPVSVPLWSRFPAAPDPPSLSLRGQSPETQLASGTGTLVRVTTAGPSSHWMGVTAAVASVRLQRLRFEDAAVAVLGDRRGVAAWDADGHPPRMDVAWVRLDVAPVTGEVSEIEIVRPSIAIDSRVNTTLRWTWWAEDVGLASLPNAAFTRSLPSFSEPVYAPPKDPTGWLLDTELSSLRMCGFSLENSVRSRFLHSLSTTAPSIARSFQFPSMTLSADRLRWEAGSSIAWLTRTDAESFPLAVDWEGPLSFSLRELVVKGSRREGRGGAIFLRGAAVSGTIANATFRDTRSRRADGGTLVVSATRHSSPASFVFSNVTIQASSSWTGSPGVVFEGVSPLDATNVRFSDLAPQDRAGPSSSLRFIQEFDATLAHVDPSVSSSSSHNDIFGFASPSFAVDKDVGMYFRNDRRLMDCNRFFCTGRQADPWWMMDLGGQHRVRGAQILSRPAFVHHTNTMLLRVGNTTSYAASTQCGSAINSFSSAEPWQFAPCNLVGRYLFVHRPVHDYLCLCEVRTFVEVSPDESGSALSVSGYNPVVRIQNAEVTNSSLTLGASAIRVHAPYSTADVAVSSFEMDNVTLVPVLANVSELGGAVAHVSTAGGIITSSFANVSAGSAIRWPTEANDIGGGLVRVRGCRATTVRLVDSVLRASDAAPATVRSGAVLFASNVLRGSTVDLTFTRCIMQGASATNSGGSVAVEARGSAVLTLTDTEMAGGVAIRGGIVAVDAEVAVSASVTGGRLADARALGDGGLVFVRAPRAQVTFRRSHISRGNATRGGCFAFEEAYMNGASSSGVTVNVSDASRWTDCRASDSGGAFWFSMDSASQLLALRTSTGMRNRAEAHGGFVGWRTRHASSGVELHGSYVAQNEAVAGRGGSVYGEVLSQEREPPVAVMLRDRSIIADSVAGQDGGAVFVSSTAWTRIEVSGFSSMMDNEARNGDGGAIAQDFFADTLIAYPVVFQLNRAHFARNRARNGLGGAIVGELATLLVTDTSFENHEARQGGTMYVSAASLVMSNSTLIDSTALEGDGGCVLIKSAVLKGVILRSVRFERCVALDSWRQESHGGALFAESSPVNMTNVTVLHSEAQFGGGVFFEGNSEILSMLGPIRMSGNRAVARALPTNGTAVEAHGGALFSRVSRSVQLADCRGDECLFSDNEALSGNGGAIYLRDMVRGSVLQGAVFLRCSAAFDGGAVALLRSTADFDRVRFDSSRARYGGGLFVEGESTAPVGLDTVSFLDNEARVAGGGAFWTLARVAVEDPSSSFVRNTAGEFGPHRASGTFRAVLDSTGTEPAPKVLPGVLTVATILRMSLVDFFGQVDITNNGTICTLAAFQEGDPTQRFPLMHAASFRSSQGRVAVSPFGLIAPLNSTADVSIQCPNADGSFTSGSILVQVLTVELFWTTRVGTVLPSILSQSADVVPIEPTPELMLRDEYGNPVALAAVPCTLDVVRVSDPTGAFPVGNSTARAVNGVVRFGELGLNANLGVDIELSVTCRWITGGDIFARGTFLVHVPLLKARWAGGAFETEAMRFPWYNTQLPAIVVELVDEDDVPLLGWSERDGRCDLIVVAHENYATEHLVVVRGQTTAFLTPNGTASFRNVALRPDEELVSLPMTLSVECNFHGRSLQPITHSMALEQLRLRWADGNSTLARMSRLLFNTPIEEFSVSVDVVRTGLRAENMNPEDSECSVELWVDELIRNRRVFLVGFTNSFINETGFVTFREVAARPDAIQITKPMTWRVQCSYRDLRLPVLTLPAHVETFVLQWVVPPPATTLPSPRARVVPFPQVSEAVVIARTTGRVFEEELDTMCLIDAVDAVFHERTPTERRFVQLLNAVPVAVSRGVVRFPGLALAGPFLTRLNARLTCLRRQGDSIPSILSPITLTGLTLDWLREPPRFVLFRDRYEIQASARLISPEGLAEPVSVGFADVIQCRIQTLTGVLELARGYVDSVGRIDPTNSSIALMLRVEGDPGDEDSVAIACVLGDEESTTLPSPVRMHHLIPAFARPPPFAMLPNSPTLKKPLAPFPWIVVLDTFGTPIELASMRCSVRAFRDEGDAPLGAQSLLPVLDPPIDGYQIVSVSEERWARRSELHLGRVPREDAVRRSPAWMDPRTMEGQALFHLVPPNTSLAEPQNVVRVGEVIEFDKIVVVSEFNRSVVLAIDCVRGNGDPVPTLYWPILVPDVRAFLTKLPPPRTVAQRAMNAAIMLRDVNLPAGVVSPLETDDESMCTTDLWASNPLYRVTGNNARVTSGRAEFDGLAVMAKMGDNFTLRFSCERGGFPIVNGDAMESTVIVDPCPPGLQPAGYVGEECEACPLMTYSDGKDDKPCTKCPPRGVDCDGGLLRMLPGFYLVASSVTVANESTGTVRIDENAEFHECFNEEACIVDPAMRTSECRFGYGGPLCGVCDAENDFARQGPKCIECWPVVTNIILLGIGATLFLAGITYVAVIRQWDHEERAPVAFRITMNFVQALGALGIYKARGTETFRMIFGFAEAVGSSFFAASPLQCLFRPDFFLRYFVNLVGPLLIAVIAIVMNAIATLVRGQGCWGVRAYFREHKYLNTVILVLHLAYTVLASQSFFVLDCRRETIGGVTYLKADLGVECYTPEHIFSMVVATASLLLFGLGLPVFFAWVLRVNERYLDRPELSSKLGFLYRGYSISRKLYWWESVSLVRKAGIVIIGSFFEDPYYAIIGALLLTGTSLALQLYFKPYQEDEFNHYEILALTSLVFTQVVSLLFLRSSRPEVSSSDRATADVTTTVFLLLINFATAIALFRFAALVFLEDFERKPNRSSHAKRISRVLKRSIQGPQLIPVPMSSSRRLLNLSVGKEALQWAPTKVNPLRPESGTFFPVEASVRPLAVTTNPMMALKRKPHELDEAPGTKNASILRPRRGRSVTNPEARDMTSAFPTHNPTRLRHGKESTEKVDAATSGDSGGGAVVPRAGAAKGKETGVLRTKGRERKRQSLAPHLHAKGWKREGPSLEIEVDEAEEAEGVVGAGAARAPDGDGNTVSSSSSPKSRAISVRGFGDRPSSAAEAASSAPGDADGEGGVASPPVSPSAVAGIRVDGVVVPVMVVSAVLPRTLPRSDTALRRGARVTSEGVSPSARTTPRPAGLAPNSPSAASADAAGSVSVSHGTTITKPMFLGQIALPSSRTRVFQSRSRTTFNASGKDGGRGGYGR